MTSIQEKCIFLSSTIRDAVACIDRGLGKIALVVDHDGTLLHTVTDGDVRRAILFGKTLDSSLQELIAIQKENASYHRPITAPIGTTPAALLNLMKNYVIHQMPLVDSQGRVIEMVTLDELLPGSTNSLQAVVMAGGFGHRLRPLTNDLPKPMLPIGDRPLLERIIHQLRESGIKKVNVTTHYKGELIENHFGDGKNFGIEIQYASENSPLGTSGVLGSLETPKGPLLVINGDILTRVDFKSMLLFHQEHKAMMTLGVRVYELHIPFGVVGTQGTLVTEISEKPTQRYLINAGIYLLSPEVYSYIPKGKAFDMPDLISALLKSGERVASFPIHEYWLDIGRIEDYEKAIEDMRGGRI